MLGLNKDNFSTFSSHPDFSAQTSFSHTAPYETSLNEKYYNLPEPPDPPSPNPQRQDSSAHFKKQMTYTDQTTQFNTQNTK